MLFTKQSTAAQSSDEALDKWLKDYERAIERGAVSEREQQLADYAWETGRKPQSVHDDGGNRIGTILDCCERGFEAFDADDVLAGVFADADAAKPTLLDRWWRKRQSNGGASTVSEEPGIEPQPFAAAFPMLAAALGLAKQRDWKVFPARMEDGKKWSWLSAKYAPGGENWGMTKDPEQLRRNFLNTKWRLKCGVGVPTGWVNRIFDIEADTKEGHGVDGLASLQGLETKHGRLPETLMAKSPTGSLHRIYNHPGHGIRVISRSLPGYPGVDIKGDGGMFVAPPSARSGGVYRWLNDNPIADAPQWLIGLITAKGNGKSAGDGAQQPSQFEIADAFKQLEVKPLADGIEYPTANIEEIHSAANAIPPSAIAGESEWMDFARALAWEAKMHPERREMLWAILDATSRRAPNYDQADNRKRFDRYVDEAGEHEKPITIATLFHIAREHGWQGGLWEQERRAKQIAENIKIGDDVAELAVPLILTPNEMIERLVWIGFSGAVVDRETFRTRKKDQAFSEYAASVYFPKEAEEEQEEQEEKQEKEGKPKPGRPKAKTRKPKPTPCLTIWMQSPKRATVDVLAWVPGAPQFCRPPENFNNAQTAFNTWRGITPMPTVENWRVLAKPFVDHVGYLVPVESERQRFMLWLAHIVQQPEVLPHTSYLMVTPKTGIGRNWMSSVLVRVLRGYVAAGISLPELLDGGFNGRLSCKLLAIVDELREGPSNRRYERGQRLKSIITEENRQINPKYGVQSIEKNCCRWLKFSNFFDALPFDNTDRRIETIANPTMRKTTAYYERIYSLLHDPSFIAAVWWQLKTMDISGFKPGAHATMNEAKERALVEMMTDVERAVRDFKDECGTALASRKDIESAASPSHMVNAAHLTHAITYAEMINTGRRVKDAYGVRHPVVIIDTARWTVEMVKTASVGALLMAMGKPEKK